MRRLLPCLVLLALTACGTSDGTTQPPTADDLPPSATATTAPVTTYDRPPVIVVEAGGETFETFQGSFCWSSPPTDGEGSEMCSDSAGPSRGDLPDVGSPDAVEFTFPVPGTTFAAVFSPLCSGSSACNRSYRAPVHDLGDGRYRIEPAGPPLRYQVDLQGRTAQGEAPGSFRWTTTVTGTFPDPVVTAQGLAYDSADPDDNRGIGFSLTVDDLDHPPTTASAEITATAADGATYTFTLRRPAIGEAYVIFNEPGDAEARAVAALGPRPIRYDVALTLDGTTYDGTGTWPTDHTNPPPNDHETPIVFDPPLPGRTG